MIGKTNLDQEAEWARERAAAYALWREAKLQAGCDYLAGRRSHAARLSALERIQEKFGQAFAQDLRRRYFQEASE